MVASHDTKSAPEWVKDDPANESTVESSMEMEDDELEFETFDEAASDADDKAEKADAERDCVPLWRLIEMSREDRSLRMELADLEDYDDFDRAEGGYAGSLSH